MLLLSELPSDLTLDSILECFEQLQRDIPGVVLCDDLDDAQSFAYLKQGMRAVIPKASDELLLLIADREFSNLHTRRQYRRMSLALQESERQRRSLLDDETDAIVYVSSGIVRFANPAFAKLLGIPPGKDLGNTPFREFVGQQDQENVEDFLLHVEDSGQALAAFQCPLLARKENEEHVTQEVRVMVRPTSYEGLFTLSLLVRPHDNPVPPASKGAKQRKNSW